MNVMNVMMMMMMIMMMMKICDITWTRLIRQSDNRIRFKQRENMLLDLLVSGEESNTPEIQGLTH